MHDATLKTRFFSGSNTPYGFISRFDKLYAPLDGWHAFLIKGGPGTGKSSLMKSVAKTVAQTGLSVEYIHCSSDPNSLDGVIVPEIKKCIIDATAPHVLEPKFPGVSETLVNLGEFWDTSILNKHQKEIIKANLACTAQHERAIRFLSASGSLVFDSYRHALECTDTAKIARTVERLARRELGPAAAKKPGNETIRMLSAITPMGVIYFSDTVEKLCPRIVSIEDEYGASSKIIMSILRTYALSCGHDIISCHSPLSPYDTPEHLLIPSLGLAFVTTNQWNKLSAPPSKRIHIGRFTDMQSLKHRKQRLLFNKKAVKELVSEASSRMLEAGTIHDELETYYTAAMDFDRIEKKHIEVANQILLSKE